MESGATKPVKIIAVTGPRTWENQRPVDKVMDVLAKTYGPTRTLILVEGGAPGLDRLVKKSAQARAIHVATVDALWDRYSHAAGPIRNVMMLKAFAVDLLLAFHWDDPPSTPGTKRMLMAAYDLGVPVKKITVSKRVAMPSAYKWEEARAAKKAKRRTKRKRG